MNLILKGNPVSTNSLYRNRGNITYMSRKGKERKEMYQWEAKTQYRGSQPLTGALQVEVKLFFGDKRIRDIDNYSKILLDALTGIIWEDDRQIYKMTVEKFIGKEDPRIEITVKKL